MDRQGEFTGGVEGQDRQRGGVVGSWAGGGRGIDTKVGQGKGTKYTGWGGRGAAARAGRLGWGRVAGM